MAGSSLLWGNFICLSGYMLWFVWWQGQMECNRSDNCEPSCKRFHLWEWPPLGRTTWVLSSRISLLKLLASYVNWFYTYKLLVLRSALTYVTSALCSTTLLYMHYRMKKWNFLSVLYTWIVTFNWLFSTYLAEDRAKCHTHPTFGSILYMTGGE